MGRRPRYLVGLLAVSALTGLLVVAIAVWSHMGVVARMDALRRGEGQVMLDALRIASQETTPTDDGLEAVYETLEDNGLVWVAVVSADGRILAHAGAPVADPKQLPTADGEFVAFDKTARMFGFLPRRNPQLGQPPPDHPPEALDRDRPDSPLGPPLGPDMPPSRDERAQRGPTHLVIEYVPENAQDLEARSRRAMIASSGAALLLWAASAWLYRLSSRAVEQAAQLAQHRHLAALGQMSAVMAHEIKNPLAALKGHAQLLARQVADAERPRAERVVGEVERLETLVYSLLDFSRTAALDRRDADPRRILQDAAEQTTPDRVRVLADRGPERWSLDATRMRQVLVNLLDNALKASPDGSKVEAEVRRDADELVFVVRDQGPGIPPEQLEQVFEPFFTTRTKGSGLGLAIVRRITRLHGGTVSVVNRPGGGAEFTVAIPAA
jgi:two-component system, NtrC family, sensor histidine kinase HydH